MLVIEHDNDTWEILGKGVELDGKVYCHLASKTRFRKQRNGAVPFQRGTWLPKYLLENVTKEN
jgi:hypothetical protein